MSAEVHRIVHDPNARRGHAELRHQIVRHALRRRHDPIGEPISDSGDNGKQPAMPRPPPVVVGVAQEGRHRRLLVEDDARADSRGPRRRQHREIAQEGDDQIRPAGAKEPPQIEPASGPRSAVAGRQRDPRVELIEIRSLTLEQIHRAIPERGIERVENLHGRSLRAAAVERRQHEADLAAADARHAGTAGATAGRRSVTPSCVDTLCIMPAACASSVCARAVS